jgi:hypothetical protein
VAGDAIVAASPESLSSPEFGLSGNSISGQKRKGVDRKSVNPFIFLVELARIELAAS